MGAACVSNQNRGVTLRDLIVPGTDDDVAGRYLSLAQRARGARFGLLEDDVVVLDTETTGLDFKSCELIEVAAARLRGDQVVEEFDRFVRPESPIPPEIEALTGITNQMVSEADPASQVMADFEEFAGDAPLIAHNAAFDRHFMKRGAGHDVGAVWVDSLELSRIVLPCLRSHKLADLSRAFGLTPSTHRAIDDVRALCGLWRVLLTAASDLPAGLAASLARLYPEVPWSYRPIFSQIAAMFPHAPFSLRQERSSRCAAHQPQGRRDARELGEVLRFPDPDEVEQEFGPQGTAALMYEQAGEHYEPRSEQRQMARMVAESFAQSRHAAVEAGTGVGKSIAYLLPAALLAQENGITVGVATKTNALADQLMNHELPLLSAALPEPLDYVALKGYDNYPCLRKVEHLSSLGHREPGPDGVRRMPAGVPRPTEDVLNAIAAIESFATQSADGDLNSLGIRWGAVSRSDLSCSVAECLKAKCPYFPGACFLHGARRRAAAADVVVTNHSLLFRDMQMDRGVLPPVRYWVVDEAHSVAAEARRQWASQINSAEVRDALTVMGSTKSGALGGLASAAVSLEGGSVLLGAVSRTASEAAGVAALAGTFFDDLRAVLPRQRRGGGYDSESVWIDQAFRTGDGFAALVESGTELGRRLEEVVRQGREVLKAAPDQSSDVRRRDDGQGQGADGDGRVGVHRDELAHALDRLESALEALRLVLDGSDQDYVYSARVSRRRGTETYELAAELIDVGASMARLWYPETDSVVFSSATIAVGEEFGHFDREVGLDRLVPSKVGHLRLDSSYDFDSHMRVMVAKDMPDPRDGGYMDALCRLLEEVHLATGGGVLTLFTNRREMEEAFERVEPGLSRHGLLLLRQAGTSNVRTLRERFVSERDSSLFGLRSFWEGFDAAGDTLRCVVIPKLPFRPPTDPLSKERDLREKDAWARHSLPEAVLTMKQAAGRLIRSSDDRGCLVLADSRLLTKGYGRTFLRAMPKRRYEAMPVERLTSELRSWTQR